MILSHALSMRSFEKKRRLRLRLMVIGGLAALMVLAPPGALASDPCLDPPYHGGAVFDDVPPWAASYIAQATQWGIVYGCTGSHFCSTEPVTRAEMAVFLELFVHGASFSPPPAEGLFGDVTGAYAEYACWIEALANDGITTGCSPPLPLYCPDNPVNRAQMAAFLVRSRCITVGQSEDYCPPNYSAVPACDQYALLFDDVPCSHWAERSIATIAALGITTGCGDGNYCPGNLVTRAQMATFLVRTVNSIGCATNLAPPTDITGN